MKKILIIFLLISMNFTFGQSGSDGGLGELFKNSSISIVIDSFQLLLNFLKILQ